MKTVLSIIKEELESSAVQEDSVKKNFEIIYVPFVEIPSQLKRMFDTDQISPEEYAAKLEPYYRTTYGVGADQDDAILSLGNDFEDNNEVVGAKERYAIGEANEAGYEPPIKASMVVMSHLSDAQELSGGSQVSNHINFAKYIILQTKGDLTQMIEPDKMWQDFSIKYGGKSVD
jgi:hypothetical protein